MFQDSDILSSIHSTLDLVNTHHSILDGDYDYAVAASILRMAADILVDDQGDHYPPDVLRNIADLIHSQMTNPLASQ